MRRVSDDVDLLLASASALSYGVTDDLELETFSMMQINF